MNTKSGKTPERVVELVRAAVAQSSLANVSKESGIPISKLNRYFHGVGEPRADTMQAMANYFNETLVLEFKPDDKAIAARKTKLSHHQAE